MTGRMAMYSYRVPGEIEDQDNDHQMDKWDGLNVTNRLPREQQSHH